MFIVMFHVWLIGSPDGQVELVEPLHTLISYGTIGTSIFILLSAFLLYLPFASAILSDQPPPSARHFVARRMRRLLPAYWFVLLLISLGLGAAVVGRDGGQLVIGSFVERPDLLLVNLLLLQNFHPDTFLTGISAAWFVCAVAVFYVTLPYVARIGWALAGTSPSFRRRLLAALAPAGILLVLGLAVRVLALNAVAPAMGLQPGWEHDWGPDWPSVLVRSFLGQSDRFAFGMIAAVIWLTIQLRSIKLPPRWWTLPLLLTALTVGFSIFLHRNHLLNDLMLETALTVGLVQLMFVIALQQQLPRLGRAAVGLLESRPILGLGLISYSVYLWHGPIIRWLSAHGLMLPGPSGLAANLALVASIVVPLAFVTYHLAERPFSWRTRQPRSAAPDVHMQPGTGDEQTPVPPEIASEHARQ